MIPKTLVLEDALVRVEPLQGRHLSALIERCGDPAIWELVYGRNPFLARDTAEQWLADATSSAHCLPFAIVDTQGGAVIGSTRVFDVNEAWKTAEIGYTFIAREAWRTPVNTHVKLLLFSYLFEAWGAQRVQLKAEARNARSRQAIERIGATYEGTLRSMRVRWDGLRSDVSYYSVLADEWPNVKGRLLRLSGGEQKQKAHVEQRYIGGAARDSSARGVK